MDSFDKIETMLAEIIEQGNEQKKTSAKLSEKMDGIDGRLGNIETASSNPQTSESVITLADHEKRIGAVRATVNKWYNDYAETKKQCDELLAERPYWATKVWPINQGFPLDSRQAPLLDLGCLRSVHCHLLAVYLPHHHPEEADKRTSADADEVSLHQGCGCCTSCRTVSGGCLRRV